MNYDFKTLIQPFFYVEIETWASVCLNVSEYKDDIFQSRADEGFTGNGYDWTSLAQVFLKEKRPDLLDAIQFDSESGMFCAYAHDKAVVQDFALAFKHACEDETLIADLFSRAQLD